jgi:rSAM/selenodomain-associated transferase 2
MKLRISIVIPTLNEGPRIQRAVASAWDSGADEVIVVDGGSQDDTLEQAQSNATAIVASPPGRAIQQNLGAKAADGDVLLFLHADCQLVPDGCRQIVDQLSASNTTFGAFRQQIDETGWLYSLIQRGNAARVRWLRMAYGDQGIFVKRGAFHEVGGFPQVAIMEDVCLMKKLRRFGRPCLLSGPIHVSARRWRRNGVVLQTARNWCLLTAFHLGVPPAQLQRYYPRHDADKNASQSR